MIGLTVCVGYSDKLAVTLPVWVQTVSVLVVVTTEDDIDTQMLCERYRSKVRVIKTDAFYRRGAAFNKAGALNETIRHLRECDFFWVHEWLCLFDADILPERNWRGEIGRLRKGKLYGGRRYKALTVEDIDDPNLPLMGDREMPGFFWVFSAFDPHLPEGDWFTEYKHAGCYDTVFQSLWPRKAWVTLQVRLIHIGEDGKNWWGVGNEQRMAEMYEERERRGGGYEHERV